jgi:hypothetical protein
LDCSDPKKFVRRSNADVYNDVDELVAEAAGKSITVREALIAPNGILMDPHLRSIFKPVDHTLRDWQHILTGDGVANSVIGETLNDLKKFKYPMQSVRDFLMQCTLPSKYGRTHADWLKDSRIKLHTLTSFSGIILTVMPILFLYMQSFCSDDPRLTKQLELVTLAHHICGILATGSDMPIYEVHWYTS